MSDKVIMKPLLGIFTCHRCICQHHGWLHSTQYGNCAVSGCECPSYCEFPTGICRQCEVAGFFQTSLDLLDGMCFLCFKGWATPAQLKEKGLW